MKYDIPEDELRRMYVEEEMTKTDIAKHFGCSVWVIDHRLNKYGIKQRKQKVVKIKKEKLKELYIDKNMTVKDISDIFDCHETTIERKISKYNLYKTEELVIPKKEFIDLYLNENYSINDLADYYNCTRTPILKRISDYNLPKFDFTKQFIIPREELYDLYIEKDMSRKEVANYYNCCEGTIDNNLQEYGIKKGNDVLVYDINEDDLLELFKNKKKNIIEVANFYGCSKHVIEDRLKRFGIKKEVKSIIDKNKKEKIIEEINLLLKNKCEDGHLIQIKSNEKYINNKRENWYKCECGWVYKTSKSKILRRINYNNGVYKCPSQRKHIPWNYIMVKKEFEERNFNLLSDTYEGNKQYLEYICPNGHKTGGRFNNFIRGEGCKECATIEMANEKRHSIEYIKEYLAEYDCELTSDYKNSNSEIEFICSCGRKGSKVFTSFKNNPQCNQCSLEGRSGENHVFWNDDLTEEERLIGRKYPEYTQWRIDVYSRDNYTCQITGEKGSIVAHHFYSYADYPDLRIDIDNGITIKEELHVLFHNEYGYGSNTKEQFEEFKERYNNGEFDKELKLVV